MYRHVLFIYGYEDVNGMPDLIRYQIINGSTRGKGNEAGQIPLPATIFEQARDYEKLLDIWIPDAPNAYDRPMLRKAQTLQTGTPQWTIWPDNFLYDDIPNLALDPDATGPTRAIAQQRFEDKRARDNRMLKARAEERSRQAAAYAAARSEARAEYEEQWARQEEERRRRNRGSSGSMWQEISPFDRNGNLRDCSYYQGKYVCSPR